MAYLAGMTTKIEPATEFLEWFDTLTEAEQDAVDRYINLLRERGVSLPFPYSSAISGASFAPLRELRPSAGRSEMRVFYAFDPLQQAVLLVGGCKSGVSQKKFYNEHINRSKAVWERHCAALAKVADHERPLGNRKKKAPQPKKNRRK